MGAGGVVRDETARQQAVDAVVQGLEAVGIKKQGLIQSPIRGAVGGNIEYLGYFVCNKQGTPRSL